MPFFDYIFYFFFFSCLGIGGGAYILALLYSPVVGGVARRPQLDALVLGVHADLQLQVLDERRVELGPGGLERRHAVRRDGHLAGLHVGGRLGVGHGTKPRLRFFVYVHVHVVVCKGRLGRGYGGGGAVGGQGVHSVEREARCLVILVYGWERRRDRGLLLQRRCWCGHGCLLSDSVLYSSNGYFR